jgi:hypothetical protein
VEADEDTDAETGADPVSAAKSRRRTRSTVVKKSSSAVATAIVNTKKWYRRKADLWAELDDEYHSARKNLLNLNSLATEKARRILIASKRAMGAKVSS